MPRKEHFVPKFYLEGFTDPASKDSRNPYIWVVDLEEKTIRNRAAKNIAKYSGYYDLSNGKSVEDEINKIENRVSGLFRQFAKNDFVISEEDRFYFAIYIGFQLVRVPVYRSITDKSTQAILMKKISLLLDGNTGGIKISPRKDYDDFLIGMSLTAGVKFWSPLIFSGNWLFAKAPKSVDFFTSDNPVSLLTPYLKPFIDKTLRIWFPLSSRHGLCVQYQDAPNVMADNLPMDVALEFNQAIFDVAQRYVYCATKEQADLMLS